MMEYVAFTPFRSFALCLSFSLTQSIEYCLHLVSVKDYAFGLRRDDRQCDRLACSDDNEDNEMIECQNTFMDSVS